MIIGITGGTGCGKTTALKAIEALGGLVLDCDAIYHNLLQTDRSLLCAIESRFPGTVVNGVLDRKALGTIVFADKAALQDLNDITHNAVKAEVLRQLPQDNSLVAIDAIGLFESGLSELCKLTVAITAPQEDRVARLIARDSIPREYALARISAQPTNQVFSALCDHTLENNGSPEDFYQKCLGFFRKWAIIEEN
ncbi:MAG: dephospho-CoA kinase [Oscillospiraceae bacterium]|nr:dephospho-CoA kinase [Oscillospiraceae bacterium]